MIFLLIISATAVSALDLDFEAQRSKVLTGDDAKYLLHITNDANKEKTVTFRTLSYDWDLNEEEDFLTLAAGETEDFDISYSPVLDRAPGAYAVSLIISTGDDKIERFLPLTVIEEGEVIQAKLANNKIDPRKENVLKLELENLYDTFYEDVQLTIKTDFFEEKIEFDIGTKEKKEISVVLETDAQTTEGEYLLELTGTVGGKTYLDHDLNLVVSKFSDLKEIIEPYSGFLIYGEEITQTNDGNEILEKTYVKEFSGISKKFTSFDPEPEFVDADGKLMAEWSYTLNPGDEFKISYKTNYGRPLIILILVILVASLVYFWVKKPLVIKKRVITLRASKGEIGIMKVMISVKNNTSKPLNGITLVDYLPKALKKPSEFGQYQPDNVAHTGQSLRLSWNVSSLRPKQERIISYKISGSIRVVGKMTLPNAVARVRKGSRKFRVYSNRTSLRGF